MSVFIDTNVVVYAFDQAEPDKRQTAIEILEGEDRLVLSTQVLLETWWVLTRRLSQPLDEQLASEVIDRLRQLPVVSTDPELVTAAIETSRRYQTAIWDALIIEAARASGCNNILC